MNKKTIIIIISVIIGLALISILIWRINVWRHTRISPNTPQNYGSCECPSDRPIKGNAQSGIYHMPDGVYYDRTCAERCFATEDEAQDAGYRKSKR